MGKFMTRILVIEDDELIIEPVVKALSDIGYKVLTAQNGKQGLEFALEKSPDLVLLDIMLPGMDGWEVCKALRANSPIPIIMVTAKSMMGDVEAAFDAQADDYVSKPYEWVELHQKMRKLLG